MNDTPHDKGQSSKWYNLHFRYQCYHRNKINIDVGWVGIMCCRLWESRAAEAKAKPFNLGATIRPVISSPFSPHGTTRIPLTGFPWNIIFGLYIYIPTNCTQLIYFINQHIKTYVLSKTLNISPTCFGHLATILREIQYLSLLQLLNYRCSSMPASDNRKWI